MAPDISSSQLYQRGRNTHRAERHPTQRLCCNFLPLPAALSRSGTRVSVVFAAPESTSDATTTTCLAFSSRKPPAPREHLRPTLAVHPAGVSHRAFPAPAYKAWARRCCSRLLVRTTVMSITTARSSYSIRGTGWGWIHGVGVQLPVHFAYHLRRERDLGQ
ncbi:hypothetical protein FIBSPDRAFT_249923 [Athelia psychrophila]|uniref:Uncharacterized protein n=1 Tax=Athelia psychrophila TaxID=1759441 RepID=A0A165XWI9_9AGAM|nr:hypothetical protein FIBSPDRAFT_249923 [Fibularhizoctonia sp. CBS 109695]